MTGAIPRMAGPFRQGLCSASSLPRALVVSPQRAPRPARRFFSEDKISHASGRVQVYISRSSDPYLNLSIEHFLLQKSHPDSVVLLLYTNRPCVVIGRNQNPWVEVNLGLLKGSRDLLRPYRSPEGGSDALLRSPQVPVTASDGEAQNDEPVDVQLVRRRSGGGTVFHDAGNINWSIICPPAIFDRDKHAEMVVRALRGLPLGTELEIRVNERHDIVMDVQHETSATSTSTSAGSRPGSKSSTFKISGSAYKLTRLRSLHHGTLLLSSPNLPVIGQFLRSPAEPYIKARGVESVRSPIRNVGLSNDPGSPFERAVVREFDKMYNNEEFRTSQPSTAGTPQSQPPSPPPPPPSSSATSPALTPLEPEVITPQAARSLLGSIPAIRKGYDELSSLDWIFAQTPQFTFSTHPTVEDPRPRPDSASQLEIEDSDAPFKAHMSVRHGQVTDAEISGLAGESSLLSGASSSADDKTTSVVGVKLHEIQDWRSILGHQAVGAWFNKLFGVTPRP
ncbi:uncharacterized protein B0I36DRAFT_367584 [Microdochium trichocladiopsis]|uniref:Putative lipoate-protein ligase A n=1 Tax=Microdochium trichocladiopsis TaxID=1682393 RepID=A0A9P9BI25_9PEZI|nr:uncharacterized protein B0I36DRAFT_367584 [Microdochium trichocladiopsis]KAH7021145.1 hypothetical protein B0I36DRAFT_367584 [Microdochium trichocladiopsis]